MYSYTRSVPVYWQKKLLYSISNYCLKKYIFFHQKIIARAKTSDWDCYSFKYLSCGLRQEFPVVTARVCQRPDVAEILNVADNAGKRPIDDDEE